MGLDVYVGSLTRYYSGAWETVVQQAARQAGMPVRLERQQPLADTRDPEVIRAAVLRWRDAMSSALGKHLNGPLDWDESESAPYFTDKPAWDCYSALLLWAAYEENPDLRCPEEAVEDWAKDPAFQRSTAQSFRTRYPHLLHNTELWLPCAFPFTFVTQDAGGNKVGMGSSIALLAELRALNDRTWRSNSDLLQRWRTQGTDHGAPLETGARFAFSIMLALAEHSVQHRIPMKLDY